MQLTITISDDLALELRALAAAEGSSTSSLARRAIELGLPEMRRRIDAYVAAAAAIRQSYRPEGP